MWALQRKAAGRGTGLRHAKSAGLFLLFFYEDVKKEKKTKRKKEKKKNKRKNKRPADRDKAKTCRFDEPCFCAKLH